MAASAAGAEEMAPDVYHDASFGNVGFVVTGEGVVVVDTGPPFDAGVVIARGILSEAARRLAAEGVAGP